MKKRICWVLFVCLCFTLGWAQSVRSYRQAEDSLTVVLSEGEIRLYPLADNAVRVKYVRQEPVLPDWVYVGNDKPAWSVKETGEEITLGLPGLVVRIDKEKGTLAYFTPEGKPILQEKERQPPFAEGKIAGGGRSVHLHKAPFGTEPALRRIRKGSG